MKVGAFVNGVQNFEHSLCTYSPAFGEGVFSEVRRRPGSIKRAGVLVHPGLHGPSSRFPQEQTLAAPYLAIKLLQNSVAVLVALLVVAHHPEFFGGEAAEAPGDLLHGQLVVALDREPSGP